MNYRDYKQFAQGNYYHIYNRGNNQEDIFRDDADYALFLSRLQENLSPKMPFASRRASSGVYQRKTLPDGAFSLACYCLMPNHFHLVVKQATDLPASKLLSKVCTSYSKCFNLKYGRIGQVFQDQFKAIAIDSNEYLVWLSAYIHANPVVAGLAERLEDWQWSSYPGYVGTEGAVTCDKGIITEQFASTEEYAKFVIGGVALIRRRKDMELLLLD